MLLLFMRSLGRLGCYDFNFVFRVGNPGMVSLAAPDTAKVRRRFGIVFQELLGEVIFMSQYS